VIAVAEGRQQAVDRRLALGLGAGAALLYLLGPGSGAAAPELGELLAGRVSPDRLPYLLLVEGLTRLGLFGAGAGRLAAALLGASGVVLLYGVVRRALALLPLGRPYTASDVTFAASFAAAGLALTWAHWRSALAFGHQALATVALLATVRLVLAYQVRPTASRAALAGALGGLATLAYVPNALLLPLVLAVILEEGERGAARRHALLAVGVALALVGPGLALAGGGSIHAALSRAFASSAPAGGGLYRLSDAMYGLARSLVVAPGLDEGEPRRLLGRFLLGALPLIGLIVLLLRRTTPLPPLGWRNVLLWIAPYLVLGLVRDGRDPARWLPVVPALWLLAAALLALLGRWRRHVLVAVLLYFGGLNWFLSR
jgi:hypothetical protein